MNEIPPPAGSGREPEKLPPPQTNLARNPVQDPPPSKVFCAFLGFLLLIGSILLTFVFPPACIIGLAVAFGSLLFEGYRYIFVGYLLTGLIGVGLIVLVIIVACGNMGHGNL